MLASAQHSRVVLFNLWQHGSDDSRQDMILRCRESLSLLAVGAPLFDVTPWVVGDHHAPRIMRDDIWAIAPLAVSGESLWSDDRFIAALADPAVCVLFFGGCWLEEDILFAAIEGLQRGYDVRILLDLCAPKRQSECWAAIHRLKQHGALIGTVRQMLLEWTASHHDKNVVDQVRRLLA